MSRLIAAATAAALTFAGLASAQVPDIDIPYDRFQLDNGLTVVVHEDRKAPIVAVSIWYGVGSASEPEGRTGFAHLFEHLMFNGSENYNDDYFGPFEQVGATGMNGTTSTDRTNYYQTVPVRALDRALWLESERMGHFIGAVTEDKLEREKGVVQNEYRQRRDRPYGAMWDHLVKGSYPQGHPYSWPTIGNMEDIAAAELDEVREWFDTHYGAANAILVVAGDVEAEAVRERVAHYFGGIDPGPTLHKPQRDLARMRGEKREVMEDKVPQARLLMAWNIPPEFAPATNALHLAGDLLASGRASRLHRELVEERELATQVSAGVWGKKLGSQFIVDATAAEGVSLEKLERAVDEILSRFKAEGPTSDELQRARVRLYASTIRGLQDVGGRGKADGALHEVTALALATVPLKALKERNNLAEDSVDDVVLGVVDPVGEAGSDIARFAALNAGLGEKVPGVQISRFCASGLDAVNFAAAQIMAGQHELVIGGGAESMSRVGIGASGGAWPMDPSMAVPAYFMPQGISADLIATKYGFSRDDVDAYAVQSQQRAAKSWDEGRFNKSVVPVKDINGLTILAKDEHMRPTTTMQSLAQLQPSFAAMAAMAGFDAVAIQSHPEVEKVNYVHHAGNSSGIVDGAGAVLLGSKEAGAKLGLKPRAKIRAFANIGSEPAMMLTGPVDVTEKLFERSGMKKSDIDLFELNEAFASVVLRYIQAFDIDNAKINVNGGAIALGHPLGATGAMILGTVLDELERTNKETALVTLCIGGGMGTATIIERV